MSEIAKTIGQRVRNYRIEKGLSQEKLAELSGCHPTYIGQVERGEKNATLESIEKIASAMNVSLAQRNVTSWSQQKVNPSKNIYIRC